MEERDLKKVYFFLSAGIIATSFAGILIKLASAPPLIIGFYRLLFSTIIMVPYFLYKYRDQASIFFDYRPIMAGLLLSGHLFFWINSLNNTRVANAVILANMQPLFTLILEKIFARADVRKGIGFGIFLALSGSVIISFGGFDFMFKNVIGDLMALAAALFSAGYLFVGRGVRKKVSYFPYLFTIYTYAAISFGFFVLIWKIPLTGYGQVNYILFLTLALGPTLIGHSSFNWSVRFLPTSVVALAILSEPVLTAIWAWIIFDERITIPIFLGSFLIITGIYKAFKTEKVLKAHEQ